MAARIPQAVIDDVLSRTDIIEVIEQVVPLKKAGRSYKACCPFHEEKSASFNVNPQKQFFYCFGCQAGGNVITFVMQYDNVSFLDALKKLASQAGIEITLEEDKNPTKDASLYDVLHLAQRYYQQALKQDVSAQAYCEKRLISPKIMEEYALGFVPDGWDNLAKALQNKVKPPQLIAAGLSIKSERNTQYDRFRHRLMFPIRDARGRTIGFGGRVIGEGEPKYLNSPETALFHKGRALYGIYEVLQKSREHARLLVTEGYMDVVALAEAGIDFAVATLGTATTASHLHVLFRHTDEVIFCFDGDKAGKQAAMRAMEMVLPIIEDGKSVRFMFLPDQEDPDSLIKKIGRETFMKEIQKAISLSELLLTTWLLDVDTQTVDGRARLIAKAKPHVVQMHSGAFRDGLLKELSLRSRLSESQLAECLLDAVPTQPDRHIPTQSAATGMTIMRRAVAILLQFPGAARLWDDCVPFDMRGGDLLAELVTCAKAHPGILTGQLLAYFHESPHYGALTKLAAVDLLLDEEAANREFVDIIKRLGDEGKQQAIDTLMAKLAKKTISADEKQRLKALLER